MEEMIEITKKQYEKLVEDQQTLRKLHAGGVDNWEGYSYCFEDEEE